MCNELSKNFSRPSSSSSIRTGHLIHFARDHDLSGFDDRERVVSAAQLELADGVARDDGGERLVSDSESHLTEQAVDSYLFDETSKSIAAAQRDDESRRSFRLARRRAGRNGDRRTGGRHARALRPCTGLSQVRVRACLFLPA